MHDVLVVGAGLAGLSCAFELKEAGADVCILDAGDEAGGVVGTNRIEAANGDSFLFERGPNTVQASSRRFRELCERVGIADRLIASNDEAKRRYLFLDGELRELPKGPLSFLKSNVLSGAAKRKIASEPFRRFKEPQSNLTLLEFFEERIGAEATRKLAGAFVRGIYAAELSELGVRSAFPRLYELCLEHGGLVRGMIAARRATKKSSLPPAPGPDVRRSALLSFPDGLCELPRALASGLGDRLLSRTRITSIEPPGDAWIATSEAGERFEARRLVLAVSAPQAAGVLETICYKTAKMAATLRHITHGRLTLIHQGFSPGTGEITLPPGFGFLVPPADSEAGGVNLSVLGTIFGSNCFAGRAPKGGASTTQFYRTNDLPRTSEDLESADSSVGHAPTPDQQSLLQTAHRELSTVLGASLPEASVWRIQRWDNVIPRYAPGHSATIGLVRDALRRHAPGLSIIGNYTDGVSVENVVGSGLDEATRLLEPEAHA